MHIGHRHQSLRRRGKLHTSVSRRLSISIDMLAYAVSLLSLLFTLDQVRIIWIEHQAQGVSLLAWIFYTLSSIVWFLYGYIHKDKALIITNALWIFFSVWIVIGVVVYHRTP